MHVPDLICTGEVVSLELNSGEFIRGKIIEVRADELDFASQALGVLTIRKSLVTSRSLDLLDVKGSGDSDGIVKVETKGVSRTQPIGKAAAASEPERPFLNRVTGLSGTLKAMTQIGYTYVENQNKIHVFSGNLSLIWKRPKSEWMMQHGYTLNEVDGTAYQKRRQHTLRYIQNLSDNWIWLNQADWLSDSESAIDAQLQAVSVPAYYVIKNEDTTLLAGIGLGYQSVDYDSSAFSASEIEGFDLARKHHAVFAYQLFRKKLTEALSFEETLLIGTAWDEAFTTADLNVTLSEQLTKRLSIQLQYEGSYLSDPAPGVPEVVQSLQLVLQHAL
jgi:opacity protein-like surface antigen